MSSDKTKTLDVIAAAAGHKVIIAGEVASLHFPKGGGLSLLASKLFVQVLDVASASICKPKRHRVSLASLNWAKKDLGFIEDAVRELQRTIVELDVDTSRGKVRKSGQVLADVDRDLDAATGELVFKFSDTFRRVVKNSSHWAAISHRAVYAMECKYSVWLYQLAALHAGRRQAFTDWPLAELRDRLGANTPSLRRWINFRNRVLKPAVSEINHLTGVTITWEPVKRGRQVVAVRIACDRKSEEDLQSAELELERPRAGRKARRNGLVDLLADEQADIRRELGEELTRIPFPNLDDEVTF